MLQNKFMSVVGECKSKVLPFDILGNEIFSSEGKTNKDTSAMIGEMAVTAANVLLADIRDKIIHGGASVKCWGQIMLGSYI